MSLGFLCFRCVQVIEVLFQKPPKSAASSPEDGVQGARRASHHRCAVTSPGQQPADFLTLFCASAGAPGCPVPADADWQSPEAFYPFLAEGCHLRLQAFNIRAQKVQDVSKFMSAGRLTDLRKNPYVELEPGRANTMKKGAGLVENDIRDIHR